MPGKTDWSTRPAWRSVVVKCKNDIRVTGVPPLPWGNVGVFVPCVCEEFCLKKKK